MDSFSPTVRCPHCGAVNKPSITGWGRTGLNIRHHDCKGCKLPYSVVVVVEASTDITITDGELRSIKSRIVSRKKRIYERKNKLLDREAELVEEYVRVMASTGGHQN